MYELHRFYIDGEWVDPIGRDKHEVINPATEEVAGSIVLGTDEDVDGAVAAAARTLPVFAKTSVAERVQILEGLLSELERRKNSLTDALAAEMGAPLWLAKGPQFEVPMGHLRIAIELLQSHEFEYVQGTTLVRREPIGVCGLIAPWNYPLQSAMMKVVPALAMGCTMVLKPSEFSPFSAALLAEAIDAAGCPPGVFNLIQGKGEPVGAALCKHPDVKMISFTGSTRAGAEVARNAATTIKRVHQELGGKSPNLILPGADLEEAVRRGIQRMMINSGQVCTAPSRMLVPHTSVDRAASVGKQAAEAIAVGSSADDFMGPVVNQGQWNRIQSMIEQAIEDGATLVCGGPGKPEGSSKGYFVRPTVFKNVAPDMAIVQEEVFGPVLVIQGYQDVDDAVALANGTRYGLNAYVQGTEDDDVTEVARRLRAGQVHINGTAPDFLAPFGGVGSSGNGREWGAYSFESYSELKAIVGYKKAN